MQDNEILELNALELSSAIHQRRVSCRRVMNAYLEQIERVNKQVNAIISLRPTPELLAQAHHCDRQLADGAPTGWMHGFPQAVKDLAATAGIATTMGSPLLRSFVPTADGLVAKRLKQAGAILIGKTNVPEFGAGSQTYNTVFGTTTNAYIPTLTAGGSSGGSAVALATRMQVVADGSDMMGSLRNPAAFNNVFGLRPSFGLVPFDSPELYMQQLATEGPMGRNIPDLLALLQTLAGPDRNVPLSRDLPSLQSCLELDCRTVRIGWLGSYDGYLAMDHAILELCSGALTALEGLGCKVQAASPDFPMEELWRSWLVLRQWLTAGARRADYQDPARRAQLKPELIWEIEQASQRCALDVYQASEIRSAWFRAMLRLFERYDYLALPAAQVFPFDAAIPWPQAIGERRMDTYHRWMEVVVGPTMAGLPAISVPVGFCEAGRPMGMQLIGPPGADAQLLKLAHAYDGATQWVQRYPPQWALRQTAAA